MTILSDKDLRALYPQSDPGPASVDLHLGDTLLYWPPGIRRNPRIDQRGLWASVELTTGGFWVMHPGIRYLATTQEHVTIPVNLAGQIAARSSWGRDGLAVICGPAGFVDPGFRGRPTLELSVVGSDLEIWPGARVCQLVLFTLTTPCLHPYSGRYQGDTAPTPSRGYRDAEIQGHVAEVAAP